MNTKTMLLRYEKKLVNQCALPTKTYGPETWTVNTRMLQQQNEDCTGKQVTSTLSVKTFKRMRYGIRTDDINYGIKKIKWRWEGHSVSVEGGRW